MTGGTSTSNITDCDGYLINETHIGECFCHCVHELHVEVGDVGNIVGIHLNEISVVAYTIFSLFGIVLFFLLIFPCVHELYKELFKGIENMAEDFIYSKYPKAKKFISNLITFLSLLQFAESGWLIIVGILFGVFLYLTGLGETMSFFKFQEELFFLFLIPPIILKSGFYIEKSVFASNFVIIMLHALFGTLINSILIGFTAILSTNRFHWIDCFVFSSLISAVDPVAVLSIFQSVQVNSKLNTLLENESIFNDAISIVLYVVFKSLRENTDPNLLDHTGSIIGLGFVKFLWVVFVGCLLGFVFGVVASFISKFTFRDHLHYFQPFVIFGFSYLSYFFAEMFLSSGILALFICGIFMSRYLKYNISSKSRVTVQYTLKMVAKLTESIIFLYLGIMIVLYNNILDWTFIVIINIAVFFFRFVVVYSINTSYNLAMYYLKRRVIPFEESFIQSFSGLRGAIAFALAYSLKESVFGDEKHVLVATALSVIIFTVFIQGTLITPLLYFLKIKKKRLKLVKKISMYKELLKLTKKIICFIPDLKTPKKIQELLIVETNKNYAKFRKLTNKFYELEQREMCRFRELQKENVLVKMKIEEHLKEVKEIELEDIKIKCDQKGEVVHTLQKKVEDDVECEFHDLSILTDLKDFVELKKEDLIKVDEYFGLIENEIIEGVERKNLFKKFRNQIHRRIADLLEKEIVDKYSKNILRDRTLEGKKAKHKKKFHLYVHYIFERIDLLIQQIVNRGYIKREKKFKRTYYDYFNYHHVDVKDSEKDELNKL